MEQAFFRERLEGRGIEVLIPDEAARERIHRVIYDELVHGVIRPESAEQFHRIMAGLADRGAQSIILGCTEIGLLVKEADASMPFHDTTVIHAMAAVDWALEP